MSKKLVSPFLIMIKKFTWWWGGFAARLPASREAVRPLKPFKGRTPPKGCNPNHVFRPAHRSPSLEMGVVRAGLAVPLGISDAPSKRK